MREQVREYMNPCKICNGLYPIRENEMSNLQEICVNMYTFMDKCVRFHTERDYYMRSSQKMTICEQLYTDKCKILHSSS